VGANDKNHRGKSLKESKILDLFRSFSKKERQEAAHFLQSFYGTKRIELSVFAYLDVLRTNFDSLEEELNLEQVFYLVYDRMAKEAKELVNLQNSCSDLYTYLIKFLVWKEMEDNCFETEVMKLRALKKRNLNKEYLSQIKRISKKKEKEKKRDFWHPLQLLILKDLHYYTTDIDKFDKESNIVPEAMKLLDEFYSTAKLKYSCELLMRERLLQEENTILLLDEVLDLHNNETEGLNELRALYLKAINVIRGGGQEEYFHLRKEIERELSIENTELFIFVGYLLNYSIGLYRSGDIRGAKQTFDLYNFGMNRELFTLSGYFPENLFASIVSVGCVLGSFLEASNIIKKWGHTLRPEVKDSVIIISEANISFSKGNFEEVILICSVLKTKNPAHKLLCLLSETKAYYELRVKYQKRFYRKCDQFETFLKGNKRLQIAYVTSGLNFINILKLLPQTRDNTELLEQLNSTRLIMAKEWLVEKIGAT
jgi:hypothetical protein